jgi:hypothetical protein
VPESYIFESGPDTLKSKPELAKSGNYSWRSNLLFAWGALGIFFTIAAALISTADFVDPRMGNRAFAGALSLSLLFGGSWLAHRNSKKTTLSRSAQCDVDSTLPSSDQ